jgi:hypothetical protein
LASFRNHQQLLVLLQASMQQHCSAIALRNLRAALHNTGRFDHDGGTPVPHNFPPHKHQSHAAQPSYILLSLSTLVAAATNADTSPTKLESPSLPALLPLLPSAAPAAEATPPELLLLLLLLLHCICSPVSRAVHRANAAAANARLRASALARLTLLPLAAAAAAAGVCLPLPAAICMA